jgi:hypothetical protein
VLLIGRVSDTYKPARADPRYPRYFPAEDPSMYRAVGGAVHYISGNFCKVLQIEPGSAAVKQDIVVEPASTVTVKIQDAEGRPLCGACVWDGRAGMVDDPIRCETDFWVAYGVAESGKPRRLIFYERTRKLCGTLTLKGDEKGPVVFRLQPCGAVRGRVVGEDGNPVAGVNINLTYYQGEFWGIHAFLHGAHPVVTDAGGRFTIDQLVPGVNFQLWPRPPKRARGVQLLVKTSKVEPGRTTDLGDIRLRSAD